MIKWTLRVLVVLAAVVVVGLLAVLFYGGAMIRQGVQRVGPQVMGVPVTLEQARFYPLRGHVSLTGLYVGNPEGFRTPGLFRMKNLEVDLNVASLMSDTIVIERILIDAPQITYEVGTRGTNLGALLARLEPQAGPEKPARKKEPAKAGKTVVIKQLILADARTEVSATAMRGRVVPVQLSTITLHDLGGEDQDVKEIVAEVVKAVLGAVSHAAAGAGDLLGEGLKSALEGAGALTGIAGEGLRSVGDTAGEGVRAASGALSDGVRSVRGLTGRRERDEEEAAVEEVLQEALPTLPEAELPSDAEPPAASRRVEDKVSEGAARIGGALGGLRPRRDRDTADAEK